MVIFLERAAPPARPRRAQWLALFAVAAAAILADQATKQIISTHLAVGRSIEAIGPLWVGHIDNRGLALGFLAPRSWLTLAAVAVVVAGAVAMFARGARARPARWLSFGLLLGGSAANLIDRVMVGHITDFVGLHLLPVFNLADLFIVAGLFAVAIGLSRRSLSLAG